ncbi:hypothetical protein GMA19_03207 [Paenibacillus polymyxa E681]|uniref:NfeD family protein n=1 Tax=Paenibacillus polymyxa TaxID=1406 RepID=UPI0001E31EF2|nr:NfeD family protein [Paenibacillus polymyxa]ADM71006.1 serine protease [Paenibacillus polymyxa E681]QNV58034.1 hypothetical protein GE561_03207 [Paenibacillus polymyxa E681]QNV62871.1 hypothetical protein GMA19_03207 [Paenibacillus polymyxa E681]
MHREHHHSSRKLIFLTLWIMVSVLLLPLVHSESAAAQTKGGAVFVIPVDQEIEQGLGKFMERGFAEAADSKAGLILLDINTPGGRVDTAEKLGKLIKDSPIPTVAYIRGEAASAGSYIALSANKIVMKPGSIIGAAALVDGRGQAITDPKTVAWWKSSMASAAEAGGRNPDIARGMVDSKTTVSIPEMNFSKENGQIVSLTSEEALKLGYADHIASSEQEVIQWMGYSTDDVIHVERTWVEKAAEILTNPIVQTLLLFIGIAGVVIELLVPGFGVPGILGILGFGLYFFGNYIAGFAGSETWLLFIIGLALLILEMFIPSFGILGILGSVSLVAGVVRAAYNMQHAFISLGIAFAAAVAVVAIIAVVFKDRGIWNRFILKESLTAEQGFSSVVNREMLLGQRGVSLTPLRPAGTVLIADERVDVVTNGEFIATDMPIIVSKVEGGRIVVKADTSV